MIFQDLDQNTKSEIECDEVVLAIGVTPENSLLEELQSRFIKVINIGDSLKAGKITSAVSDGYYYLKHI